VNAPANIIGHAPQDRPRELRFLDIRAARVEYPQVHRNRAADRHHDDHRQSQREHDFEQRKAAIVGQIFNLSPPGGQVSNLSFGYGSMQIVEFY
jgi:hypothetical protein